MPIKVTDEQGNTHIFPDGSTPEMIAKALHVKYSSTSTAPKFTGNSDPSLMDRYESAVDPYMRIENPDPNHPWNIREAGKAIGNIGAGGLGVILHPVNTLESVGGMITAPIEMLEGNSFNSTVPGQLLHSLRTNPYGTVESAVGGAAGAEAVPEVIGPVARGLRDTAVKVREGTRQAAQSLMGAGGRAVKGEVAKASEAQKAADEAHSETTQEALHETAGRELKHQQDVKTSREAAERESRTQTAKQIADRNQAIEDRRRAEEKLASEKLKQGKISPMQAKLQNAWSKLRATIETARERASVIGNTKYNAVNDKLNPVEANMETLSEAVDDAREKLKGTEEKRIKSGERKGEFEGTNKILDSIRDRFGKEEVDPDTKETVFYGGKPLTYKDLQGYYSELGNELSKGNLPGDVYTAYDNLHEAIGNEMQRIADEHGAGAQLLDARNYWRRMKQTFGKPLSESTVAADVLRTAAPDLAKSDLMGARMNLYRSFDPEISQTFNHIRDIQKGIEALPKPTPDRELTAKADIPNVPSRGTPVKVEPKPVAPPERVALPDRPEQSAIDTRALREKLVDRWATGESSLNKWQVRALLSGGLSAIIDGLGLLGGHSPGLGSMALEAGGTAAYTFGPAMVAKMLEKPAFREWITRPPEGELETLKKLPNADRIKITDGLSQVVQQAQKQGIRVSPALGALVGVAISKGPKTQKLQKTAEDARNATASQ